MGRMKQADKILSLHLNSYRMAAKGHECTDKNYFDRWKRIYPDTYKQVIQAMEDHKNNIVPDFGRDPKKKY